MKALGVMMAAVSFLIAAPAQGVAQTDLSGMWDLTIQTDQGDQPLTITIAQDGMDLVATGDGGEIGEVSMTGTIDGSDVRFDWALDIEGQQLLIVFAGTLAEDGTISGTIDLGGFGQGGFTAKRSG